MKETNILNVCNDYDYLKSEQIQIKKIKKTQSGFGWLVFFFQILFSIIIFFFPPLKM